MRNWVRCFSLVLITLLTACAANQNLPSEQSQQPAATMPLDKDKKATTDKSLEEPTEPVVPEQTSYMLEVVESPKQLSEDEVNTEAFDQYLAGSLSWSTTHIDRKSCQYWQDADGRIIMTLRGAYGGVLPDLPDGLVFYPSSGLVTELWSPWRQQEGWCAQMPEPVTQTLSQTGLTLIVPEAEMPYLKIEQETSQATLEDGEQEILYCGMPTAIKETLPGDVLRLYRIPRTTMDAWTFYEGYPEWYPYDFGLRGWEIARDSTYVYFMGRPTDIQFDTQSATECKEYAEHELLTEMIVDAFVLENHLELNPWWLYGSNEPFAEPEERMRTFAHSFQTDGHFLYFTMLLPCIQLKEGDPVPSNYVPSWGYPDPDWQLVWEAEDVQGPVTIGVPDDTLILNQRYSLNLTGLTKLTVRVVRQGQTFYEIPIIPGHN